jgi:hypothetical protein
LHPDIRLPPDERISWLKNGCPPLGRVAASDSDIPWEAAIDPARDPATGKWRVEEGDDPVLYLPTEEAVYWAEHGHAPPGSKRTHDLDNNKLTDFETFYCVSAPLQSLQRLIHQLILWHDFRRLLPKRNGIDCIPIRPCHPKNVSLGSNMGVPLSVIPLYQDLDGKPLVPHSVTSESVADRN